MHKPILSHDLLPHLQRLINLPSNPMEIVLRLVVNSAVEVQCTFYPEVPAEIDVTKLTSTAMEYELDPHPITKRYNLVEITEPEPTIKCSTGITREEMAAAIVQAAALTEKRIKRLAAEGSLR